MTVKNVRCYVCPSLEVLGASIFLSTRKCILPLVVYRWALRPYLKARDYSFTRFQTDAKIVSMLPELLK